MFCDSDKRNVEKVSQTAILLVQDIQGLVQSDNPLLSDIAIEILQQAVQLEQRLRGLDAITHADEKKLETLVIS